MGPRTVDTYQLAGFDARERGFSRPVDVEPAGEGHRAVLRYETIRIATDTLPTPEAAVRRLIELLHAEGYRQLRSQMSFRGGVYLGARELWVEYPDPQPRTDGWWARVAGWFRPRAANE